MTLSHDDILRMYGISTHYQSPFSAAHPASLATVCGDALNLTIHKINNHQHELSVHINWYINLRTSQRDQLTLIFMEKFLTYTKQ